MLRDTGLMACVRASRTPNPNAMKFTLDVTLSERILANRGDDVDDPFTRALLGIAGVASVFGVNDFVTVTREPDADWDSIVCAVEAAAEQHLSGTQEGAVDDSVDHARALLRDAVKRPAPTAVEIRSRPQ